ncbi:Neurogenic locus protein delta-like protein [Aphelenchoides fujianensis]|nr:Neurogenic locus protein delta-like protein [Aphelenchoides fujianensis]
MTRNPPLLLLFFLFCSASAHLNLDLRLSRDFDSLCGAGCRVDVCVKHFQRFFVDGERCLFGRLQFEVEGETAGDRDVRLPLTDAPETLSISLKIFNNTQSTGDKYTSNYSTIDRSDPTAAFFWSGALPRDFRRLPQSEIFFRGRCDEHFFGPTCRQLCEITPVDEQRGHFVCNEESGRKECADGFTGVNCDQPNDCGLRCRNGACSRSGECVCRFGYQGPNCDECVRAVGCANGFCSRPHECVCFPGFAGPNCTQKMAVCEAQLPCLNGGTCYNRPHGRFECKCAAAFKGTRCERPEFGQPLRCKCPAGFHGDFCQTAARSCADQPCEQDAPCVQLGDSFHCICPAGFSGAICDRKQTACGWNSCANNGTCVEDADRPDGFRCDCAVGFFGAHCQKVMMDCRTSPCLNGGECRANITTFHCHCPAGFAGGSCEVTIKPIVLDGENKSPIVNFYVAEPPAEEADIYAEISE